MDFLSIFLLAWLLKSGVDHMRADFARSRDAYMGAAAKKAGGALPPAQHAAATRHHARGYVAREVLGGFPSARTGLRLGWLAHRTAVHDAMLQHADARDTADDLREQVRQRRAARRAAQEQAITDGEVPQDASPAAAAQTADEVAAARERRRQKAEGSPQGTAQGSPDPGPYAPSASGKRLSSWVRPGDSLCETCGGTGGDPNGAFQCPECRGFGTGPGDPDGPEVPDGICTACGNPARPGDPVIREPNGQTHRSHILDDIAERKAMRDAPIDDAVIDADHSPIKGDAVPATSDTTFQSVIDATDKFAASAENAAATARTMYATALNDCDAMTAANCDAAALDAQSELCERLKAAETAWNGVTEQASVTKGVVRHFHGGMQEAHDSSPGRVAERAFHENG